MDAAFGGFGAQVYNSEQSLQVLSTSSLMRPSLPASLIPSVVMLGRDECLKKCGIDRDTFDISSVSRITAPIDSQRNKTDPCQLHQVSKQDLMKQAMEGWLKMQN